MKLPIKTEMESHKRLQTAVALVAITGTDIIYHAAWTKLTWGADNEIVSFDLMSPFKPNVPRVQWRRPKVIALFELLSASLSARCKRVKVLNREKAITAVFYLPKST